MAAAQGLLDSIAAPPNVVGLSFIGQAIAVPWSEINCYVLNVDREADVSQMQVESAVDDELAKLVLDRFESSSGNRPTLLKTPGSNGLPLIRRDGRRRVQPYNLLFDADPRAFAGPIRPPSPVQDVPLNP